MGTISTPAGTTTTVDGPLSDNFQGVPLLTVFTPPKECASNWVYDTSTAGTVWKDSSYNHDYPGHCLPFAGQNSMYRPGICPSGQVFQRLDVTVESTSKGATTPAPTWYVGYCCTTGYKLSFRNHFQASMECFGGVLPPAVATVRIDGTSDDITSTSTTTTLSTALVAVEEPVNIVWNEADLTWFPDPVANSFRALMGLPPITSTKTSGPSKTTLSTTTTGEAGSPPSATQASTPSGIPPTTGAAAQPPQPTQHISDTFPGASTLSSGALAGISVGAVVFLALVLTAVYLACARRRRKKREQRNLEAMDLSNSKQDAAGGNNTTELQDTQIGSRADPFYIAQRHTELQGTTVAMPVQEPVELEARPWAGPGAGAGAGVGAGAGSGLGLRVMN